MNICKEMEKVSNEEVYSYYENHSEEFNNFIKVFSEEELCRIANEINSYEWNEKLLGKFRNGLWALTLYWVIECKVGYYKILKYAHLVVEKGKEPFCKTEAEYDSYCLERLFNDAHFRFNPLNMPKM